MSDSVQQEFVLRHGLILCDPDSPRVTAHAQTVISGERLLAVNVPIDGHQPGRTVLDCSGCLIMPGLVNCHTHAAMSLLRGIADDLPLDQWLQNYIFPAEATNVAPDFVYLGTLLSAVEMALAGVTTFADAYFFMEHSAAAALEVGLRAVIAQGILDVPAPDAPIVGSWKERIETFLAAFPNSSMVRPALFCHSPYLCSPETLRSAANRAREQNILLFTHAAETGKEVEIIKGRHGARPVEHLANLGVLGPSFVAVHAVHLSEREKDLLADSGTKVVHCPESNMKLASGAAPVVDLLSRGVVPGLGTDGPASNNNLDLFEEMRSASLLAKLVTGEPEALDARTTLRMATIGGARVLGLEDQIGSLEPGKCADVIVVDFNRPHLSPVYDPISHLVYAARGSDVRDVFVNGRPIVRNGQITTVDEEKIKSDASRMASNIARKLGLSPLEFI